MSEDQKNNIIKSFIEFMKLPPNILAVIAIVCSLILFLPQKILLKIGLNNLQNPYRLIVGILFMISSTLLILYILTAGYKKLQNKYYKWKFKKQFPKMMEALTESEKAILSLLYQMPNLTHRLPLTDGLTLRLRSKNLIQMTSNQSLVYGSNMEIPFTITPLAYNYIKENPEFLEVIPDEDLEKIIYAEQNDW